MKVIATQVSTGLARYRRLAAPLRPPSSSSFSCPLFSLAPLPPPYRMALWPLVRPEAALGAPRDDRTGVSPTSSTVVSPSLAVRRT